MKGQRFGKLEVTDFLRTTQIFRAGKRINKQSAVSAIGLKKRREKPWRAD